MNRVIVLGSANTDLTVLAPQLPKPGETVGKGKFEVFFGGKGANQALAALKCGVEVFLIARIGTDPYGQKLAEHLEGTGLPCRTLFRDQDLPAGVALIIVESSGMNQIVVAPGSNAGLNPEDVQSCQDLFIPGAILLSQLEIPLETITAGLKLAKSRGMTTILNPAPFVPLNSQLLNTTDILTPNRGEAAGLIGADPGSLARLRKGLTELCRKEKQTILMTMGEQGVLMFDYSGIEQIESFPVQTIDTVAAGDAFNGTLAAALAMGNTLDKAVRLASAAGALCTTRRGAQESLPNMAEIETLSGLHFSPK